MNTIWELTKNGTLLATLTLDYVDHPWFNCNFYPTPSFQNFKPVFEKLSELSADEDWMAYEEYFELEFMPMHIILQERPSGNTIREYELYIDDGKAWFRY